MENRLGKKLDGTEIKTQGDMIDATIEILQLRKNSDELDMLLSLVHGNPTMHAEFLMLCSAIFAMNGDIAETVVIMALTIQATMDRQRGRL